MKSYLFVVAFSFVALLFIAGCGDYQNISDQAPADSETYEALDGPNVGTNPDANPVWGLTPQKRTPKDQDNADAKDGSDDPNHPGRGVPNSSLHPPKAFFDDPAIDDIENSDESESDDNSSPISILDSTWSPNPPREHPHR